MDVRLDGEISVTLSERNLKDLLKQVEDGGNEWIKGTPASAQLVRTCEIPTKDGTREFVHLRVQVEPDDVHYGDRTPGRGVWGDDV